MKQDFQKSENIRRRQTCRYVHKRIDHPSDHWKNDWGVSDFWSIKSHIHASSTLARSHPKNFWKKKNETRLSKFENTRRRQTCRYVLRRIDHPFTYRKNENPFQPSNDGWEEQTFDKAKVFDHPRHFLWLASCSKRKTTAGQSQCENQR